MKLENFCKFYDMLPDLYENDFQLPRNYVIPKDQHIYNINAIFKKNQVVKARIFYVILCFSLIYLLANFIYDFVTFKNFV